MVRDVNNPLVTLLQVVGNRINLQTGFVLCDWFMEQMDCERQKPTLGSRIRLHLLILAMILTPVGGIHDGPHGPCSIYGSWIYAVIVSELLVARCPSYAHSFS